MMGFTWAKDPTDDMWHVPVSAHMYLCKKWHGGLEWSGVSESIYKLSHLSGKVCENCLLEEIVIEVGK